ncbi:MAG: LL-diaminopimelate aminotransferase [Candidatus Latescibacteria bacterium]|nr:LL-diaminopimelate aminotransferase [Candidatus Latescibacterota bacterium]
MSLNVTFADRLTKMPPYLFAAIDEMKAEAKRAGKDVINLGVGDPDLPTPPHIIKRLQETATDPANHQYPSYTGMMDFRKSMAAYYKRTRNVELDASKQVLTLIGSKEGVGHIPLAFINPGDTVLVPDPGYPVYGAGTTFANGEQYLMPLLKENGFLPDLDAIPSDVASKAKLMFINYPNNPTAACCDMSFFSKVVDFAKEYNIIVVHDAAYADVTFDGYHAPSFLETPGALDVGIELYSLSKTYNMTGWRIAAALGNADIVSGLGKVKTNLDSGAFQPIQYAGMTALDSGQECVTENNRIYEERRDILVEGLQRLGWNVEKPKATFYIWIEIPKSITSTDMTALLIKESAIVTTPGVGFGKHGEGYIRMTVTTSKDRLIEAVERMAKVSV